MCDGCLAGRAKESDKRLEEWCGLVAEQPERSIGIRPERNGLGQITHHIPEKHQWMTFNFEMELHNAKSKRVKSGTILYTI